MCLFSVVDHLITLMCKKRRKVVFKFSVNNLPFGIEYIHSLSYQLAIDCVKKKKKTKPSDRNFKFRALQQAVLTQ